MSEYIKTNWNTGDVIIADKLNNMEDGIANANSQIEIIIRQDNGETNSLPTGLTVSDFKNVVATLQDNEGVVQDRLFLLGVYPKQDNIWLVFPNIFSDMDNPVYKMIYIYNPTTGEINLAN